VINITTTNNDPNCINIKLSWWLIFHFSYSCATSISWGLRSKRRKCRGIRVKKINLWNVCLSRCDWNWDCSLWGDNRWSPKKNGLPQDKRPIRTIHPHLAPMISALPYSHTAFYFCLRLADLSENWSSVNCPTFPLVLLFCLFWQPCCGD